ncbi:TPA: lipocalin family protein, partial [Salmonella enterica subsp. enterica]|nr:lipocalin family protein [Salmonella enterica subsp. enterica]
LWILSRTPTLSEEIKQQMLAVATREGFDVNKLIWVKQSGS